MTTPPPAGPDAPADSQASLRLSRLLKRPVTDRGGGSLGRLADVIVRLRGADYPLVTGLVAAVGGREIFVPIDQVSSFDGDPLRLSSARLSLRHFERRDGEVLLRADVLGHRLIDVPNARLVRAADLELARVSSLPPSRDDAEWVVAGVDTLVGAHVHISLLSCSENLVKLLAVDDPASLRAIGSESLELVALHRVFHHLLLMEGKQ